MLSNSFKSFKQLGNTMFEACVKNEITTLLCSESYLMVIMSTKAPLALKFFIPTKMGPNHETLSYGLLNHSSPSHLCRLLSCNMTWTDQGQWNHTSCTQLSLHLVRVWLRAMRTSVHRNKSFSRKRKEPAKGYKRKKKRWEAKTTLSSTAEFLQLTTRHYFVEIL